MNTSNAVNILKAGLSLLLVIKPTDQFGNPTVVDGIPEWNSSDESVITLSVSGDGLSARATSVGPVGTASVSVIADADLSGDVRNLTGVEEITVVAGEAVSLGEEVDLEAVNIVISSTPIVDPATAGTAAADQTGTAAAAAADQTGTADADPTVDPATAGTAAADADQTGTAAAGNAA